MVKMTIAGVGGGSRCAAFFNLGSTGRRARRDAPYLLILIGIGFFPLQLPGAPVVALAYAPDNSALVSNGDRRIEVRSPRDGAPQRFTACNLHKMTSIQFATRRGWLLVGGGEPGVRGEVRIHQWPSLELLHSIEGMSDTVTRVVMDLEGRRLGAASADGIVRVWEVDGIESATADRPNINCRLLWQLTGHSGPVLGMIFANSTPSVPASESDPAPAAIVTASADRSLKVWSADDGKLLRSLSFHTEAIQSLEIRPPIQGRSIPLMCATAGDDRTVRLWQPQIGRMLRIIRQHDDGVLALAWSPDGARLYSAGREGVIRVIDGDSDALLAHWQAQADWIYSLAVSPDGKFLASGSWNGQVMIHDLGTMEGGGKR